MWIHSTPPHGEGDESEDSSRVTVVTERQMSQRAHHEPPHGTPDDASTDTIESNQT
jgi:hypothetical protein